MKSLILKDLYNITHNIRSLLLILVVFAIAFIPTSGASGYVFASAVLCSMMIVTTFSFDDFSKWTRYALVMPISRKELVAGKFIVLMIFSAAGSLFGVAVSILGTMILKGYSFSIIGEALLSASAALALSLIMGSISIPLVFRFGAENARTLLLASFLIPSGLLFCIYKLLTVMGVALTEGLIIILLGISPLIAIAWCYLMYRISYCIFRRQEL